MSEGFVPGLLFGGGIVIIIMALAYNGTPNAFDAHCQFIGGTTEGTVCLVDNEVVVTEDEFLERVE